MPKRFSRYEFALKAVDGAPPGGSPAGKYRDYKTGVTKPQYTRENGSNPGSLTTVGLKPFGTVGATIYVAQYSERARGKMGTCGLSDSALGIDSTIPDNATVNPGFVPAKAVVQRRGSGGTPTPSKITGVSYKKGGGAASYTFPMGRKGESGEASSFVGMAGDIRQIIDTQQVPHSVSFKPEVWRM
jgi:hypothetical protein